jgi:hypothetical protein
LRWGVGRLFVLFLLRRQILCWSASGAKATGADSIGSSSSLCALGPKALICQRSWSLFQRIHTTHRRSWHILIARVGQMSYTD